MNNWLPKNPSTLVLAPRELLSLQLRGAACRVACVAGRLWVTSGGSRKDVVLGPGDDVSLSGQGKVVIEALRTATVRIEVRTDARETASASVPGGRLPTELLA